MLFEERVQFLHHVQLLHLAPELGDDRGAVQRLIAQGPPDWAPATNLTPHEEGLAGYTFEQFEKVMREGTKPNGEHVAAPMTVVTPYAARMTDTEMQALWLFISTLEPRPTGR